MPQVEIDDRVFDFARRCAEAEGYPSVDAFITEILADQFADDASVLEGVITPQVLSDLRRISHDIRAGAKTFTIGEVEAHFQNRRKAWLASHGG